MPEFYKDTSGNFLAEIWKEYSKADSRYATGDAFIKAMETITAFAWGPMSLVISYALATKKAWRYPAVLICSLGQLYGDVLYYYTCILEGAVHTRPEFLYFWFYFVILNAVWIVVPSIAIAFAWSKVTAVYQVAEGFFFKDPATTEKIR